jgi:thiol:disulfide interchange protein
MKPERILLIAVVIWAWGGFLMFHGLAALPLWIVWTMGPLCWYLGSAVMLVAGCVTVVQRSAKKRKETVQESSVQVSVLQFQKLMPGNATPAGMVRELPPIGDF